MEKDRKVTCQSRRCGWIGKKSELLSAPDPFNEGEMLQACPKCRIVEDTIYMACDYEGCTRYGDGGYPLKNGDYAFRCHAHQPTAEERKERD